MAAARSPWKRLHADLEDGDECLPISKRICSLHIESQTQGLCPQSSQGASPQGVAGSSNGAGAESAPFVNTSHQFYSGAPPLVGSCRLDSLSEHPTLMRASSQNQHGNNLQTEADQRHAMAGPVAHFSHSISDPGSSSGVQQHKLDHTFLDSRNLLCMPASHLDQSNRVAHSNHVLHPSSFHNGHPTIHSDILTDPAGNPHLQGGQQFHLQQLPNGIYDPELGMEENPYYFSVNQMLYEAHLCRVRRESSFLNSS